MDAGTRHLTLEELKALAEILLAAAYSDGELAGEEEDAIERLLVAHLEGHALPDELDEHLRGFDPDEFDLEDALARVTLESDEDRRALLSLVAEVVDADDVHDWEENAFLEELAAAAGASEEDLEGLTFDVVLEVAVEPPDLPGDA